MFEDLYSQYGNMGYGGGQSAAFNNVDLSGFQYNGASNPGLGYSPSFTEGLQFGAPTTSAQPGFMSGFMGKMNNFGDGAARNQGGFNMALNAAIGAMNAWNNFQNNKLQKDTLNFNKNVINRNYENQRKMTNMELSDRQARRVSANPNAESVDSYMKKWGV